MTEQLETTFIDKSAWPRGPWDAEPDEVQWVDAATGLDCLAVRQPSAGHWCGYVGVPEAHPLFGKDYDACHEQRPGLSVHGGLTFASLCNEKDAEHGICCHVPQPGRPDRVWWLGFDCAHAGDVSPGYAHFRDGGTRPWETYRTLAYVRDECARLAAQLTTNN